MKISQAVLTILLVSALSFCVFAQNQNGIDRNLIRSSTNSIGNSERPLEIIAEEIVLLEAKREARDYIQIPPSEHDRKIESIGKLRIQMQDGSVREMDLKNVKKVILEPAAEFDIKKNPPRWLR